MSTHHESGDIPYQSKKDKFHLIRVPKGFDISKLNGVKFDPHQIMEIQVQKCDNELVKVVEMGSFTGQKMDLNVLLHKDDGLKIGPQINQHFLVNKSIRFGATLSNSCLKTEAKRPVGLPSGLKERFSPFGAVSPVKRHKQTASKHKHKSKSKSKSR